MTRNRRPGDGSKIAGAGAKIPKRQDHHWWPRGLSKLWADDNGEVSCLTHTGKVFKSNPKELGKLSNAHFIKFEGPWNATIEPIFDFADNNLPPLVIRMAAKLVTMFSDTGCSRIQPLPLLDSERDILAEGLASLVIRSPAFRERIRLSTSRSRQHFGLSAIGSRDNLIAGNIHQWFPVTVADFKNAYFVLLRSNKDEFVLGEGYFTNLSGQANTISLRAVVPLTPQLAVLAFSGSGRSPLAVACAVRLTDAEVAALNDLAQVYTKNFIFFRSHKPPITKVFEQNEFMERPYHRDETVELLIDEVRKAR